MYYNADKDVNAKGLPHMKKESISVPEYPGEIERLKTLIDYNVLDTEQEAHLDEVTKTAALICDCRISLISLIDDSRQWFKSRHGLDVDHTPEKSPTVLMRS